MADFQCHLICGSNQIRNPDVNSERALRSCHLRRVLNLGVNSSKFQYSDLNNAAVEGYSVPFEKCAFLTSVCVYNLFGYFRYTKKKKLEHSSVNRERSTNYKQNDLIRRRPRWDPIICRGSSDYMNWSSGWGPRAMNWKNIWTPPKNPAKSFTNDQSDPFCSEQVKKKNNKIKPTRRANTKLNTSFNY